MHGVIQRQARATRTARHHSRTPDSTAIDALVVDHTPNRGDWARSCGYSRGRHRASWGGRRTRRRVNAVPGPHCVAEIVAHPHCSPVIERVRIGVFCLLVVPLPFGPESIDVAVQQKEHRIARRGRRIDDVAGAVADVGAAVRLAFDTAKLPYLRLERQAENREHAIAECKCRCFVLQARRLAWWEAGSAQDAELAFRPPLIERMTGDELDAVVRIGKSHKRRRKDLRRGFVPLPVWQRHRCIEALQLAFEIQ